MYFPNVPSSFQLTKSQWRLTITQHVTVVSGHMHAHCSSFPNTQKGDATQMSTNDEWINKYSITMEWNITEL